MYEPLHHNAPSDSRIASSSSGSSFIDTTIPESDKCACHVGPMCNHCKRERTRRQTAKHRKNKESERALFLAERDYERKTNFELQGQLLEAQRTIADVIQARRVTCGHCKNSFLSDARGFPDSGVVSDKELDDQLEECQKFLSGLKAPITLRRQLTTESKSTQCRRNKDRNFKRCLDLLQWAINELSKRTGQIASLRRQAVAALKHFSFDKCPVCGNPSPSTEVPQVTPYSAETVMYYNIDDCAPLYENYNVYAEHSQHSHVVGACSNSIASRPSYDASYGHTTSDRPVFPPPPPCEFAAATEQPVADTVSEFLMNQQAATAPSALPPVPKIPKIARQGVDNSSTIPMLESHRSMSQAASSCCPDATGSATSSLIRANSFDDHYSGPHQRLVNDLSAATSSKEKMKVDWEIPRHQLQLQQKLGDGNFAEVWYGKWRGVVEVAIKTMKPGTMSPEAFRNEAQIMKQCEHANLVKLYAVCTTEEPFYIITEFMPNGALLGYLRNPCSQLSVQAMVGVCAQVASGMQFLEERKLVHRDLAARNVLVGEQCSGIPLVKVADFGLARMEEHIYEARTGAKFPIKWTAPEAAARGNFTVKSDVWSYGVLLYEIFTRGQVPYPGLQNREVIEYVEAGYRMACPKNCAEVLYNEIMLKCWDKIPEMRPTFAFLFRFFVNYSVSSQANFMPPRWEYPSSIPRQ